MAQIIPEDSLTASYPNPELHHALKQLPDTFKGYQQLGGRLSHGIRYWVTYGKQSALITTLPNDALSNTQTLDATSLHHHPAIFELLEVRNSLLPSLLHEHAHHLLPIILLLPSQLEPKQTIHLADLGLLAIGKILYQGALPIVLERCLGMAASERVITHIHSHFNPEVKILPENASSKDQTQAMLLDYQQQAALSVDLYQAKAQSDQAFSLRLVLGLAGSGKSQVLIQRAALLQRHQPNQRLLILSHNKAISNSLKHQILSLTEQGANTAIHCHPFLEWCRKLLGGTWQFVYADQEVELFDLMIKRHFEDTELSRHGLVREIHFIKDRMLKSETDYLNTLRSGRSFALSNPVRKRIWQAMVEVDTHLKTRNCYLWADAPAFLLKAINDGKRIEPYQHILIDEAQYFAPAWMKVITQVMSTGAQLFMTSDPDQGFCNRSLHWQETGLDFRGRTIRLQQPYRCSTAIAKVVDNFRLHRLMEEPSYPLYSITHIDPITPDSHPQLLHFTNKSDQKNRLFSEINQLIRQGQAPGNILILNADKQSTRFLAQEIRQSLHISANTLTGSMVAKPDSIQLCDLDAATGLQSETVFITGLEKIFDAEADTLLSERERNSLRVDNTHLLHMAMTRASKRLYLLLSSDIIPDELIIDGLDIPSRSNTLRAPVMYINQ